MEPCGRTRRRTRRQGARRWLRATGPRGTTATSRGRRRRRRRRRRVRRAVHAPPSAPARLRDAGARDRRRRRRHLVLEPLPGRPLRHPDHRLHVLASTPSWRRRGRGRRSTPPSPRSCATSSSSPSATTSAATSASRPGSRRRRGTTPPRRADRAPTGGDSPAARTSWPPAACRCPRPPDIDGAERFQGEVLLHEPLAARGRRLHRQAGRRDRHRVVGHPVDPADRRAGRRAGRVPAHAELLRAGPERPGAGRRAGRSSPRTVRPTANGEAVDGRRAHRPAIEPGRQLVRRAAPARSTRRGRPASCSPGAASSPTCSPASESNEHRRRADPRADPRHRRRSRDGRGAVPEVPRLQHQADVPRHQLLRHVQPAPRPPRRSAQAPDHDGHRDRHRHGRRVVRVRRDRLRHRLRRHDRRHRLRRHHGPGRPHAQGQVGRTGRTPTSD